MRKNKLPIHESSAGGHIDIAYGTYDRPGPDEPNIELPDFEPVVPKEQVSVQLSADRPPIDDPDYLPSDNRALGLALSTLASYVPDEEIAKLYKLTRDKVEDVVDTNLLKSKYSGDEVMESVELKVRKMIAEQFSDKDLEQMQADFDEEFGPSGEPAPESEPAAGEASLEQIASKTGFAGPSGVKNFLYRLLSRMSRFENVPGDELDALVDFAAGEYVDVLAQADLIDEEDAKFMSQNKEHVYDLPSFKFFIGNAIAAPALKELERTGRKKVNSFVSKLGLSDKTLNTLMNQLMGQVPRNDQLIYDRIDADVKSNKLSAEKAAEAKSKIKSGFDAMKELAQAGDDFVEVALQRYSKLSKSKLLSIVKKAADDPYVAEKA